MMINDDIETEGEPTLADTRFQLETDREVVGDLGVLRTWTGRASVALSPEAWDGPDLAALDAPARSLVARLAVRATVRDRRLREGAAPLPDDAWPDDLWPGAPRSRDAGAEPVTAEAAGPAATRAADAGPADAGRADAGAGKTRRSGSRTTVRDGSGGRRRARVSPE